MKALSIGRDQGCNIVINDHTDVISRRHAILNISSSGKITIVDQSRNGTYVNGIRISQNAPVPVSRKDVISFAHIAKLDWNAVPKANSIMRYAVMGAIGVLIVACGLFAYQYIPTSPSDNEKAEAAMTDSVKKTEEKKDTINKEKQQKDSINQEPKALNKKKQKEKKQEEKKQEKKEETQPAAPKDSVKNNRPIG